MEDGGIVLLPTLKDVAERAGVTVTTISRMLNGRVAVSEKTTRRIRQAMEELGYHPNEAARALAKKSSNVIGLIVPSAKNFFFSSVIHSVEHYASANDCKLLLCVSDLETHKEKEYFNMLTCNKVMGIILASHTQDLEDQIDLLNLDAPVISIDRVLSDSIPSACPDNYKGGYIGAKHLIERGCTKLVYVGSSTGFNMDANKRYLGMRDACRDCGLELLGSIDVEENQFIQMDYRSSVEKAFALYPDLDGILTSNDVIAAAAVRCCRSMGVSVPEQVKIVGYDDSTLARHCVPQLTTIYQPVDDICCYAVQCIVRAAAGEIIPTSAVFPVALIERETT